MEVTETAPAVASVFACTLGALPDDREGVPAAATRR
jgi:hypothetical protein